MPHQVSHRIPPTADVLFPVDVSSLSGPCVAGKAEIVSLRGDRGVGCLTFVDQKLSWLEDFEHFVFQVLAWLAEGTDLWGHQVSCRVADGDVEPCVAMARKIQRELDRA